MAIQIVKGENATLKLRATEKISGKPISFAGLTGATASFYSETDDVAVSVTGTNPETNLLSFPLAQADTLAMKAGDSMDFEYRWVVGTELFIERVEGQLNVIEQLF